MRPDRYDWLFDRLAREPSFIQKPMFGCLAYYVRGKLAVVTACKKKPWNGILFPAEKDRHASLLRDFPEFRKHPILGKWLYLEDGIENFEEAASKAIRRIEAGDARFGVIPSERRKAAHGIKAKRKR